MTTPQNKNLKYLHPEEYPEAASFYFCIIEKLFVCGVLHDLVPKNRSN